MKLSMRWLVGLAVCGCLTCASQALAGSTIYDTFDDTTIVFPSQTSVSACSGQDTCPDGNSPPDITTITVYWDDTTHALTKITITSTNGFPSGFNSLYINSDYTGNASDLESWDYYALTQSVTSISSGQINSGQTLPGNGLYKVVGKFDPSMYTTFTAPRGALDGRVGHANGIDSRYLDTTHPVYTDLPNSGQSNLAKYTTESDGSTTLTYDFASLGISIILGDNFAIGYTPYCANDVVLVTGTTDDGSGGGGGGGGGGRGGGAVPEPATMALFGLGMAGLASWRIRQAKNKE